MELGGKISASRSEEYSVGVVPVPFCAMRSISEPRYLEEDREETGSGEVEARKADMEFRASRTVSRGEIRKYDLLQVIASIKIKLEDQLYVD